MTIIMAAALLNWAAYASEPFGESGTLQKGFLSSVADPSIDTCAAFCGLQGGKTLTGADALFTVAYGPHPAMLPAHMRGRVNAEIWIISKDYRLAQTALDTFRWRTPQEIWLTDKEIKSYGLTRGDRWTFWLAPRLDSEDPMPVCLRVRTAKDAESLRATPVLVAVLADELAHWSELAWLNLQGRGIVTRPKYIVTTTPNGKNFVHRSIYVPGTDGSDPSIAVYTWTSADNPYADKAYLEKLRKKFGPDYARQELDGMFIHTSGYVYDYDRLLHTAAPPSDKPEDYKARVIGVDPGYGDPYAAGVWLKDWDNRWWCAGELYLPSKAIVDDAAPWIKAMCARWKIQKVYVDKRRPSDWEGLKRKGIPAYPNLDVFGEDDRRTVMPMIRMVQRLFREGRIKFDGSCEWHAEELERYAFKPSEESNTGEVPIDHYNHCMDAMRYAICSVDALPEDRRVRYRTGPDLIPAGKGADPRRRPTPLVVPTMGEALKLQDVKFDRLEHPGRRVRR